MSTSLPFNRVTIINQRSNVTLTQRLYPPGVILSSIAIHLLSSNLQLLELELLCPMTRDIPLEPRTNSSNEAHQHLHSNKYAQQHKASTSIDTVTIEVAGCINAARPVFPLAGPAVEGFLLVEPCWVIGGRRVYYEQYAGQGSYKTCNG